MFNTEIVKRHVIDLKIESHTQNTWGLYYNLKNWSRKIPCEFVGQWAVVSAVG